MKWSRAVHHLEDLAQVCAEMATRPAAIFPLRVTALWTFGEVLAGRDDLDSLPVVLAVDLPVEDIAWLCSPSGAEHWSHATGLAKRPVVAIWRSTRGPLWNHRIRRPLLIWDESAGIAADALQALRDGTADPLRLPEPTSDELGSRLDAELAVSLQSLESTAATYQQRRFTPGRQEPLADALWRATAGYLDVLQATGRKPRDRAAFRLQT
ncbi:MAG TPA: hypothetical protein VIJ15_12405 [Dermatophilaceae bacterium]